MRILLHSAISFLAFLFLLTPAELDAQHARPPHKARERICQMKKMKLLEVLDLKEEKADKFIVKYSSWENKLEDQRENIEKASKKLMEGLDEGASESKIEELSENLLKEQREFFELHIKKVKDFENLLSPEKYAKLLVFENRFPKELGRMLMKHRGRGRPPRE